MTALLAPARLPLNGNDSSHHRDEDEECRGGGGIDLVRYGYVQSLIFGERVGGNRSKQRESQRVFCVSLPDIASVSRSIGGGYRSLTEPALELENRPDMAMATAVGDENAVVEHDQETAPSSPPELSYSKSSKSSASSFRSSSSLSEDGSTEKLSHFEDVTLQEDDDGRSSIEDCNVKPESRPTLKRPKRRSPAPSEIDTTRPVSSMAMRESRYPSLKGAVNGALRDQSLNLPHGRTMRRGFTSPSSPSFIMHGSHRIPSRSPSPGKPLTGQNGLALSPETVGSLTPRTSWSAPSPNPNGPLARRQSWQPGRKSVKQLEAEYDDEDVEVPAEAILENVPITPIPGQPRSKTPSPHRRPSGQSLHAHSHANLHSAKVPKNAKRPSAPTIMPNGQYGSPRSPRHPRPQMMPHSATVAAYPTEPLSYKHRSKSWTEDLSEEARQLSAALEEYSDRLSSDLRRSGTNSVSSSPPRPKLEHKDRAKTTILDLPPVQKGNVMIDPLPISKEKEAVLTRTRPSWLPPKNQKEEKKHMKEWEQMMARAAEAEKKRALKLREDKETKEEMDGSISRLWEEHVLPHWETAVRDPKTRELWWKGVTPSMRGQVWHKAIGNELGLSPSSFEAAFRRANEVEEKVAEMPAEELNKSKEAAWFSAIERDVPNVYPELHAFEKGTELHDSLTDVLKAYAVYRSDVGYVFGVHLMAGLLCFHMPAAEAFVSLANLLNRALPLAFLVHDQTAMARHYDMVLSTLKYKFTKLHSHLTCSATGLRPDEYLDPLFRCLFAYNLSPEHVSRIWDIYVFEGDKSLIRSAVAVLGRLESKLYGSKDEILDLISWRNEKQWPVGSEDEFIKAVRDAGKVDGRGEVHSA